MNFVTQKHKMNSTDIIGSIGVVFMLVAFFINLQDYVHNDHPLYITLNLVGAGFSCYASYMIHYLPFVILEGTWCIVSVWGIYVYFKRDYKKRHIPFFEKEKQLRKFIEKIYNDIEHK